MRTEVLIVGGGVGGCAAAIAACELGRKVILTEPTDWIGGQLTNQMVPPDENPWIEHFGCTPFYREMRDRVRRHYSALGLTRTSGPSLDRLNPGRGWVSRLCAEPRVFWQVLLEMLQPYVSRGQLTILTRTEPFGGDVEGDLIRAVGFEDDQGRFVVEASWVIDATEEGELLPMLGAEFKVGAESREVTGEPHAVSGEAEPDNVQGITHVFAMGYDPDQEHVGAKPELYDHFRSWKPAAWPDVLLSWTGYHPHTDEVIRYGLFDEPTVQRPLFTYRRIVAEGQQVTLVNWPQNDWFEFSPLEGDDNKRSDSRWRAQQLSRSLLYWLQTEAPRPDGGTGWPGLHLRPDVSGTRSGLAMAPYVRESRRIEAMFTVLEQHVGLEGKPDGQRVADPLPRSVGTGCYRIDLHPSSNGTPTIDIPCLPFTIPLGMVVPVRLRNLLAGAKNVGSTHITNGCYRLHPVEWNLGEAAGALAAWCFNHKVEARHVVEDDATFEAFRDDAAGRFLLGDPAWPEMHPV